MKQNTLIFLSLIITIFFTACGGGGATVAVVPDKNDTNQSVVQVREWELSVDKAPQFTLASQGAITDFSAVVYDKHPRLYFRDTDVAYLKGKATGFDWDYFKNTIIKDTRLPVGKATADALAFLDMAEAGDAEYAKMMVLLAFIERNSYYIDLTKAWAMHLANPSRVIEGIEGDILLRRRIERLSEIYDWFHDDLSSVERKTIRTALLKHVDRLRSFEYMKSERNYIQKHSRWGDGVVAQALLVMYGDFDNDFTKTYADTLLSETREHFRKYADAERYIAADGGWHLGWSYAYFNSDYTHNYFIWSTATTETMLDDWMGEMTYWYLYAIRADKKLPQMGDASITTMGHGMLSALYQAKFKKDGFAKWYVDETMKTQFRDQNHFMQFLLEDKSVQAKTPTAENLPLSRYFKQVGTVIARDTWDLNAATLLIFKSSPFYNAGHHHRDENSFTVDYKTALALDSGYYDQSDSNHYKNYYVRTIAHNAMTVYNPMQTMYYHTDYNTREALSQKIIPNDGGQVYKNPDSIEKKDIVEGAANHLDGIKKYTFGQNYTYMQGDATKAYDPASVTLAKRDMMYVKDAGFSHPAIVILDRVEATDGAFQKRYLLHMQADARPDLDRNNNTVRMVSTGKTASSKMTNITLFPRNAVLRVVGGQGKEFAYYDDVNDVNTTPLDNPSTRAIDEDFDTKVGNYRLEVSPPPGDKYDVMLNVILVDDNNAIDVNNRDVLLLNALNSVGVQFPNHIVVFSKEKVTSASAIEYRIMRNAINNKHTVVTGYTKGDVVKVFVNDTEILNVTVGDSGCVDFSLSASRRDVIKVSK